MNSMPMDNNQKLHELTWKEHGELVRRAAFSGRLYGIWFAISLLLIFTVGIVSQIVFLFCFMLAFMTLARLSQPVYSAFVFVANDKRLPQTLPKPPASAYLLSMIRLLISVLIFYLGIIAFQKTGFCTQSLGCMIVTLVQRMIGN